MPNNYPLVFTDDESNNTVVDHHFMASNPVIFDNSKDYTLDNLVYQITKEPKNLFIHLQRIYFCYSHKMPEQLYAGLIDLFTSLAGKGKPLSQRMIFGTRGLLSKAHQKSIEKFRLTNNLSVLHDCRYTVLKYNLQGTTQLVKKVKVEEQHDPLVLVNGFIEYSQIDSAIDLLERTIHQQPDRQELQKLLLKLYKSTQNEGKFRAMYKTVLQNKLKLIEDWGQLEIYFNQHTG